MNPTTRKNLTETLATLPASSSTDWMPQIREALATSGAKVVILDDDPTGTQTVHDVTVLTTWEPDVLTDALRDPSPAVFVLTNTRGMTEPDAADLNREIGANLRAASEETKRSVVIISRSDSTLRGHFPRETDVLAQSLRTSFNGVLIIPAFMAGGRYTIDGVHYVADGDELIPAAQTPFAQDAAFGYVSSDLRKWVAEKTGGDVAVGDVAYISIEDIRVGGVEAVQDRLMNLTDHTYCVVDAVTERDLEIVALACLWAEAAGMKLLYRTAASFAALRAGITLSPLLTPSELQTGRTGGGLVVVGSYVRKSSQQLDYLLNNTTVKQVEIRVPLLLDDETRHIEIDRVVDTADPLLHAGETVVIYTSRELLTAGDADTSLNIGQVVSASVVSVTRALQHQARFIIAKGGITSSDIATKALECRRARVAGQILPGVPVWELDETSAEPDMVYVVFPGNVGDVSAVADAVAKFTQGGRTPFGESDVRFDHSDKS